MMNTPTTLVTADEPTGNESPSPSVPGVLLVNGTSSRAVALGERELVLGRGDDVDVRLDDERLSRRHVALARRGGGWVVRDLSSRNGTFVDGERLTGGSEPLVSARLFRFGNTLAFPVGDLGPFASSGVTLSDGLVVGPTLRRALSAIELFARTEKTLHLVGETGAGKEVGARTFHAAFGAKERPFIALNCAAVPATIAERLLFGARRGAYSGAHEDAEGYLQAAHGGTLFLDEIAELELPLQAKLLRVLETGEVVRLGATRPERVELRLCTATNVDLRERVASGAFRSDLYYRLGRPSVTLPPLRERLEEIPLLVESVVAKFERVRVPAPFVEACVLRAWPGNVRELLVEVRCAVQLAIANGQRELTPSMLAATAGKPLEVRAAPDLAAKEAPTANARRGETCTSEEIERALTESGGNVAGAARRLGVHRTTLRRLLAQRRTVP